MSSSPTQIVENYEFLGIVDKPKTGVTYKVRNLTNGELEVLRTLPGSSANDPETRERFLREIRVHTRLAHPNIVAFHDAFQLEGRLVMTAEFVEGVTLAELCRKGPLPAGEAVRIVSQVLSGLEEAHALGIVHRAITPDHVPLKPDGGVKLGGFGLAKPATDVNLTQTGALLGNPRYISPEQVMGALTLDARSDIYSVGILLYQALTGNVPFDSTNDFDVMVEQMRTTPPPPSALNPAVPPEFDRIVLTALAKEPGDRFPTARDFRLALGATSALPSTAPPPAQPALSAPQFLISSPGTLPIRISIALGVLSVAFALIVIFYAMLH